MSYWGLGFWWVFPLFFGGLWLLLVAVLSWRCGGWGGRPRRSPDAMALLRERFGRGNIDAEEYEQRRKVERS
jgi:uncharacterized membrane protein